LSLSLHPLFGRQRQFTQTFAGRVANRSDHAGDADSADSADAATAQAKARVSSPSIYAFHRQARLRGAQFEQAPQLARVGLGQTGKLLTGTRRARR